MHNSYKAVISKKNKVRGNIPGVPKFRSEGDGGGFRSMPGINGGDSYILCEWNNCMVVISCGCIIIDSCNSVS